MAGNWIAAELNVMAVTGFVARSSVAPILCLKQLSYLPAPDDSNGDGDDSCNDGDVDGSDRGNCGREGDGIVVAHWSGMPEM